ncbi:hypothetical protein [Kitasatospora sp. NPDC090091]|uniref:hypothetical protein n=1 Tax=Kitasatospora sp. NPDC090091 TaxID=3364081 RepID=UPI00382BCA54
MDEKQRARAAKMQAVAEDDRVPDGLREAALNRLAALQERHGLLLEEQVPPPRQPAIGSRVLGAKAEATWDLPTRDVAALIKAEIKTARQPAPRGPARDAVTLHNPIRDAPKGTRIHVSHRLSTGSASIAINVRGLPNDWAISGSSEVRPGVVRNVPSSACRNLAQALWVIGDAYNWRGDGYMQDYVDCRFFFHVELYCADGTHLNLDVT